MVSIYTKKILLDWLLRDWRGVRQSGAPFKRKLAPCLTHKCVSWLRVLRNAQFCNIGHRNKKKENVY